MSLLDAISGFFKKQGKQSSTQTVQQEMPKPKQRSRAKKTTQTGDNAGRSSADFATQSLSLGEWKAEIERIQNHPLTQAKIINDRLLNAIYGILEQINQKIDALGMRIEKIEARSSDNHAKHVKVKEAVSIFEAGLSSQERKILELVKKKKARQATDIADVLNISRSNASLKLNKLFDMGVLDKDKEGKDTFYKIK